MRTVLDANVIVSAFVWGGNPHKIIKRVYDGLDMLFITDENCVITLGSKIGAGSFNGVTRHDDLLKVNVYSAVHPLRTSHRLPQKAMPYLIMFL